MQNADIPETPSGRFKPLWIPTEELKPGMVIADAVSGSSGSYATLRISAGGVISEETIAQLLVKGIECVAIVNTAPLTEPDYALAQQRYAARLEEIFGAAPHADCLALMAALIAKGPSPWQ